MDHLFLNTIAFPVRRGVLFRGRKSLGDCCWELEVYCDESLQFADQEAPDDLLAGAAPLLSAQSLPLRVESPDELIGREYLFPPTRKPDPPDWDTALGWPFFFLYVWEGCPTEQLRVAFTGKRAGRAVSSRDRGRLHQQRRVLHAAGPGVGGVAGVGARTRRCSRRRPKTPARLSLIALGRHPNSMKTDF